MIELDPGTMIVAGTSLVVVAMAFARAEVKQRVMQKDLQGKAEKDVVEVQLEAMDGKLDLIIDEVRLIQGGR